MKRALCWLIAVPTLVLGSGCSLAPKSFRDMVHTSPIVRARAVGLGDQQADGVTVPAMIDRLDDSDCVVRMAASDNLKTRTGRDFGFVPWGGPEERAEAVGRWKSWWAGQRQVTSPGSPSSAKVAGRVVRGRRNRRGPVDNAQGGANPAWSSNHPTLSLNP